jgi:BTB/POZ domain
MSHSLDQRYVRILRVNVYSSDACSRTLSAGIAHLDVGTPAVPFDIHIELLCDCSPYFDRLFKDRAVNDITEQPICLPDEHPTAFAELASWMYRRQFSSGLSSLQGDFLSRLWVLAATFEMPAAQNAVMAVFVGKLDVRSISVKWIDYIYSHTQPESPLRLLMLDVFLRDVSGYSFVHYKGTIPREFLEDICHSLIKRNQESEKRNELESINSLERYLVPVVDDNNPEILESLSKDEPDDTSPDASARLFQGSDNGSLPSREDNSTDIAKPASPAQMARRKIKHLPPRVRGSSPAFSSTSGATLDSGTDQLHV